MRKISSAPSLHGPRTTDLEYAERIQLAFQHESNGLSVLHPKVKCSADESVLWRVQRHLQFMTLSYVQAGLSLEEMLHHICILKEMQNACQPAILVSSTKPAGFLIKPSSQRNDESYHCKVENIDIHFAYPSFQSYSAAMETLGQLTDLKVLRLQMFRRTKQGPALGIVRVQCNPDDETQVWLRGLQNAGQKFAHALLELLKAGYKQAKFANCGITNPLTNDLSRERTLIATVYGSDDSKDSRVPQSNLDLCNQELHLDAFTKDIRKTLGILRQNDALQDSLVVNGEDLKLGHEIGLGSSGDVYVGMYREQLRVAVKVLKDLPGLHGDFRREILALSLCRHKHIVPLVGTCIDSKLGICIVTKLMEGGSLREYLQRMKNLQAKQALRLARDIAEGMHFLHSRGIIHMDLKTPNIFLDKEGTAVIGDLGSARFPRDNNEVRRDIGTYRWMAPEVLEDEGGNIIATPKSDVYSYGILLWELVSCEVPFADYSPVQAAVGVMTTGLRPTIPRDCFPPLKCLIKKCWSQKPIDRPNFSQILKMLKIISSHPSNS